LLTSFTFSVATSKVAVTPASDWVMRSSTVRRVSLAPTLMRTSLMVKAPARTDCPGSNSALAYPAPLKAASGFTTVARVVSATLSRR
jgi:hypothetical protein